MRVKFPPGQQRAFLEEVLRLTHEPGTSLARQIGVCDRTFRDWKREKWQMDDQSLDRLCRLANLPQPPNVALLSEHWSVPKAARLGGLRCAELHGPPGTFESRQKGGRTTGALIRNHPELARQRGLNIRKSIQIPPRSEELAEFIGVFLGDGGFRNAWQLTISFNQKADREYATFIQGLVRQLFELKVTWSIRERWGAGDLLMSSTALVEFLEEMGLRRGRKVTSITGVPAWIEAALAYRTACLRGLMDTDGCVYQHRYRINGRWYAYPKLCFAGVIPSLCQFVERTLQELGIPAYATQGGQRVFVHSLTAVRRYFEVVGTHNPRYWRRFEQYAGEVPKRPHGGGLLNRCTGENRYRGFESLPLRSASPLPTGQRLRSNTARFEWRRSRTSLRSSADRLSEGGHHNLS